MNHTKPYLKPKLEISFGERMPEGLTFTSRYESCISDEPVFSTTVHQMIAFAKLEGHCEEAKIVGPVVPRYTDIPVFSFTPLSLRDLTVSFS